MQEVISETHSVLKTVVGEVCELDIQLWVAPIDDV